MSFVDPDKEKKKKRLLERHPPLSPKQIREKMLAKEKAKAKMTRDVTALEQNLREFSAIEDPLVNPANNKVLCWIKRPTREEFDELIPKEFWKYRNSPEEVPKEIAQKYEEYIFTMMEKLITKPKHDAAWWRKNSTIPFMALFQMHLAEVYEELGIQVGNF